MLISAMAILRQIVLMLLQFQGLVCRCLRNLPISTLLDLIAIVTRC